MRAIALRYMSYIFARIHKTLRCAPAMEAGASQKLRSVEDIVELADNPKRMGRADD